MKQFIQCCFGPQKGPNFVVKLYIRLVKLAVTMCIILTHTSQLCTIQGSKAALGWVVTCGL